MKDKLKDALNIMTLGKYQTSLYYRGRLDHTSYLGSFLTLFSVIVVGFFSCQTIYHIITRSVLDIQYSTERGVVMTTQEYLDKA